MCITSVERVQEYIELPAQERRSPSKLDLDSDWLKHGSIQFLHVSARYRPDLPPALSDVTFTVKPGQKVGICGRSGSGKSTLLGVLWRLIEQDEDVGTISVDGVDIRDISLSDYRGAMSIIPQGIQSVHLCNECILKSSQIQCSSIYHFARTSIQRASIQMRRSGRHWRRARYESSLLCF